MHSGFKHLSLYPSPLTPPYPLIPSLTMPSPSPHRPSPPQAARNVRAMLAARALARLAGLMGRGGRFGTSPLPPLQDALKALLTPYLAGRLAEIDPRGFLADACQSCERPHLIWDAEMREGVGEVCGGAMEVRWGGEVEMGWL